MNKNNIVLKKLSLQNFRGFAKCVTIDFDKRLTVLIGNNGAGKTSVLDAISTFLMFFRNEITDRKLFKFPQPLDIEKRRNDNINNNAEIYENILFVELDYEKQNEEIGLIASSIKIKPDNIAAFTDSEDQNAKYESILNDFVQNIRIMSVENKKDFNLPVLAYYGTDFIDTKIYIKEDELLHVEFFDTYVGSLETEKFNFKQFFLALDKQQKIKLQDSKKKNNFLIAIEKAISSILSDGQTKYTNLRIEWGEKYDEMLMDKISNEIKETLFINQMSSGEKTLIALVADIVRRLYLANSKNINPLEGHGIVLIDEIELHLHPKWQRKVLPKLLETFPNIQFVITTHSPLVLDTLKPNNIRLLLNNEFIIPDFYPKGREIGEILEELMGENAVSIQAQVDEYFKLIAQNKISEANTFKQEVLLKLTDSENPIFYHANAMLKLKST